jgi:hypothetical protein
MVSAFCCLVLFLVVDDGCFLQKKQIWGCFRYWVINDTGIANRCADHDCDCSQDSQLPGVFGSRTCTNLLPGYRGTFFKLFKKPVFRFVAQPKSCVVHRLCRYVLSCFIVKKYLNRILKSRQDKTRQDKTKQEHEMLTVSLFVRSLQRRTTGSIDCLLFLAQ